MIVDAHSHVYIKEHLSEENSNTQFRGVPKNSAYANPEDHFNAVRGADKVFVLGMWAPFSGIRVPNSYIADYIKKDPARFIGFMSIDPNDKNCIEEMEKNKKVLGLRGLKLLPMYQDFNPADRRIAYPVYEKAQEMRMPLIIHMGTTYLREAKLKYTQPILMEDVALDFPELRVVIAHLGHPWEEDTIVLIRKQPNIYADISALYYRPWQCYNSLRLAKEYGVLDKLFFGTDFPATTVDSTIKGLHSICEMAKKADLPPIEEKDIETIINANPLVPLGLD